MLNQKGSLAQLNAISSNMWPYSYNASSI